MPFRFPAFAALLLAPLSLSAQTPREIARAHYTEGFSLILDEGRWTDSEAASRAAMAADPTWVLGRALVARITSDVEEREALLRWIEEHLDEADAAERLLLDLFVLNIRSANARDRGEEMPPEFREQRQALAINNCRAYLDRHPTDPYISAELVEWIHNAEGAQAALDAIQTEIHPDAAQVPFFLYSRAALLSALGRHDEALTLAEAFEQRLADPLAPAPHQLYAQIFSDMGRLEEARERIERAVALDEGNLTAQGLRRHIEAQLTED
ncbi:MAG: hypothetical protein R3181_01075 [Rubricoccaceae bacterium]|nr:hypothetical protein [Rubricoccaceae bacterium]